MALRDLAPAILSLNFFIFLLITPLSILLLRAIFRLSPLHPLHDIPGPWLPRITSLWLVYHAWIGDECTVIHALHQRYGPLVRTGPGSVHISSGSALHDIYNGSVATKTSTTGFFKPSFYSNFDIDGHISIFSALDPAYRAVRAKAVTSLFSTGALRKGQDAIDFCVERFIARLKREKARALNGTGLRGRRVDVLDISRGLAIDAVTKYLFGEAYGGCDEDLQTTDNGQLDSKEQTQGQSAGTVLTASAMVNAFVAVGRFWYLQPSAFSLFDRLLTTINPDRDAERSIAKIDVFVESVVSQAVKQQTNPITEKSLPEDTYQSRLLTASISPSETHAQCKDLIFAGTDSTAMNLATIMHSLASSPSTLQKLKTEIEGSEADADPQTLPYLRATIREGLRVAMANPSRLARVVPPSGWTFEGNFIPAGTVVGCSTFELHFNPEIFPEPRKFTPERWLEGSGERLEAMNRDFIPFGAGPRQCIARNLATVELFYGVREVVRSGLLEGSKPVKDRIRILEWFNSKVVDGQIEIEWDG